MTSLEFVHSMLLQIAENRFSGKQTPDILAWEALAILDPYLERRRQAFRAS